MQLFGYNIIVSKDNVHIEDSYTAGNKVIKDIISYLKKIYSEDRDCIITRRKKGSLIREWRAHNVLYKWGLFKSHTKDVDLNDELWYRRFIFNLLSILWRKK